MAHFCYHTADGKAMMCLGKLNTIIISGWLFSMPSRRGCPLKTSTSFQSYIFSRYLLPSNFGSPPSYWQMRKIVVDTKILGIILFSALSCSGYNDKPCCQLLLWDGRVLQDFWMHNSNFCQCWFCDTTNYVGKLKILIIASGASENYQYWSFRLRLHSSLRSNILTIENDFFSVKSTKKIKKHYWSYWKSLWIVENIFDCDKIRDGG